MSRRGWQRSRYPIRHPRAASIRGHYDSLCPRPGIVLLTLFLFSFATPAYADCTNPVRVEGAVIYNEDQNVPQVCAGSQWVALGVLNPAAGGGSCTNPDRTEGAIVYNVDNNVLQYCDGTDWIALHGGPEGSLSGPSGCANIGDLCVDGTVFAGWHPITYAHLFIPTTDQEQPGAPGTFAMNWKNATGTDDINPDSDNDGQINHANRGGAIGDFQAFQACEDLSFGGHTDWYLPSRAELYYIWSIRGTIEAGGNITNFQNAYYWSSTEYNTTYAWYQVFTSGRQGYNNKTNIDRVRCVRR